MTSILDPIYPAIARKALTAVASDLTLIQRNNGENPELAVALRRAAAKVCEENGVVSDEHIDNVTSLMNEWVYEVLPSQYIDFAGNISAEQSVMAGIAARRKWIINMFGDGNLTLIAAWMVAIARSKEPADLVDTAQFATAQICRSLLDH